MLDGGEITVPRGLARRRGKRERIGLGAAAREDHVLGTRSDETRDPGAGLLDRRAGGAALGMH